MVQSTQLAIRAAVGAIGALWIAQLLALPHPAFALISAVIVTDLQASRTRRLGGLRILATFIGSAIGAILDATLGPHPLVLASAIFIAMITCDLLRIGETAKLAGFVAALVFLAEDTSSWVYATYRLVETITGIAVAWLLALVPPLLGRRDREVPADGSSAS
jgi:uncharacterized membrane protein YgaE (UPF0421/DUF939 family)